MLSDLTVIGTGSLIMGDDSVGVRIIERLACDTAAPGCDVAQSIEYLDGSVGGLRLLNWIEQANRLLFVDGARFGGQAGECRLLAAEEILRRPDGADRAGSAGSMGSQFSLHQTDLVSVLRLAKQFYRMPPAWLLAIQVQSVEPGDGLSATLSAALPRLTQTVRRLAQRLVLRPV